MANDICPECGSCESENQPHSQWCPRKWAPTYARQVRYATIADVKEIIRTLTFDTIGKTYQDALDDISAKLEEWGK
jgi:hypothetical protein